MADRGEIVIAARPVHPPGGMDLVAIPLFEDDVAPRFCAAREFLVVRVGPEGVGAFQRTLVGARSFGERLDQLRNLGVTTVLCCGFDGRYLPLARAMGLRMECGLAGRAEALADALAHDELGRHRLTCSPRCARTRRTDPNQEPPA
jgi:hypothetical protein